MSTNYFAACANCHVWTDLAVRYTGGWTFGISSKDREGHLEAGEFIMAHTPHDFLVIISEGHAGEEPWHSMREIEWKDMEQHTEHELCYVCGLPYPDLFPKVVEACKCDNPKEHR